MKPTTNPTTAAEARKNYEFEKSITAGRPDPSLVKHACPECGTQLWGTSEAPPNAFCTACALNH
jgi:hypothetical protein